MRLSQLFSVHLLCARPGAKVREDKRNVPLSWGAHSLWPRVSGPRSRGTGDWKRGWQGGSGQSPPELLPRLVVGGREHSCGEAGPGCEGVDLGLGDARNYKGGRVGKRVWSPGGRSWDAGGAGERRSCLLPLWGDVLRQKRSALSWYLRGTYLGLEDFDVDISQTGFWIPEGRALALS